MKKLGILIALFCSITIFAQLDKEDKRIIDLRNKLEKLALNTKGLHQNINLNVTNIQLATFVAAVGKETKTNLIIGSDVAGTAISYNFVDVKLIDVLLYLCKEHDITLKFTGNIIALKRFITPQEPKSKYISRDIPISYNKADDLFSIDLQQDSLSVAFKKITDATSKNLVFSPGLGNKRLSGYIKEKTFDSALNKLAFANDLRLTKTKDGYYLFESLYNEELTANSKNKRTRASTTNKPKRRTYRDSNFYFKVLDSVSQKLEVDFENVAIESVIQDIGHELNINSFTSIPLKNIGTVSIKASEIFYDDLLDKMLNDSKFTYKKSSNIYFFGNETTSTTKSSVVIPLMHRSIEIMNQPISSGRNSVFASSFNGRSNGGINNGINNRNLNSSQQNFSSNRNSRQFQQQGNSNFNSSANTSSSIGSVKSNTILSLFPEYLKSGKNSGLDIKTDIEQNAFIVTGDELKIQRFKEFIKKIDKPVPVILIEVMILEVNKSNTLSAGVEFGVGEKPVKSTGSLFPSAEVTLGAGAINKLIGGFNGFGSLNAGKVVPGFYAKIQAMESNGNIKIRSTPKLSTLNGHKATLSSGETSYYAVTESNVLGVQNPQTQIIRNYLPIDANLSISIKPLVSGDDQITLGINVLQSSFNGKRVDEEAPPGINSREFTSTIRVKDQDVVILGGLEENVKNDSGSGVPFLARIPIIKWLFSKRVRTASKSKLSVLIRPTVIK